MPPQGDILDRPVVAAARKALELDDVEVILAAVPAEGEDEARATFDLVRKARRQGPEARQIADLFMYQAAARIQRRSGNLAQLDVDLRGLDLVPVVALAQQAVDTGNPDELVEFLDKFIRTQVMQRFRHVLQLQAETGHDVPAATYGSALLGFLSWTHKLWCSAVGNT
jgi:hypothetical protein